MNDENNNEADFHNPIDMPFTLVDVLEQYDKIEIPTIQRNYAQGRQSKAGIRAKFLDYILTSLAQPEKCELDFVYGYSQPYKESGKDKKSFVPVDGQQRLTTLWLLHWLLAIKAGRGKELAKKLEKFTYATRPSSKIFVRKLCKEGLEIPPEKIGAGLKAYIEDLAWFGDEWKLDKSIDGFLVMLEAIATHQVVKDSSANELIDRLLEDRLIIFYFLELKSFELGEEIYTRMNARGKMLTNFETFKSRLYKFTREDEKHDILADRIEGAWVDHLWAYKKNFLVDEPFLHYFKFISTMLIYGLHNKTLESKLDIDFLDDQAIAMVYPDMLGFLIHAFDMLPLLQELAPQISFYWGEQKGLKECLDYILNGKSYDSTAYVCVFAALLFLEKYPPADQTPPNGINGFLRVVRNLVGNTPDAGERELPEFIASLKNLIGGKSKDYDVYRVLLKDPGLSGFRVSQRIEEVFKANLLKLDPTSKPLIKRMDDNPSLKAKIASLILQATCPDKLKACLDNSWGMDIIDKVYAQYKKIKVSQVNLRNVESLFNSYEATEKYLDEDWFNGIWGDLLPTSMYVLDKWVYYGSGLRDAFLFMHPEIYCLVKKVCDAKSPNISSYNDAVECAIEELQKQFISEMVNKYGELSDCDDPREQLYLLYIYNYRCTKNSIWEFFKEGRFNFGWVPKERGYTTPFPDLNDGEDGLKNQIFQAYHITFQAHGGIIERRTPDVLAANAHNNFSSCLLNFAGIE